MSTAGALFSLPDPPFSAEARLANVLFCFLASGLVWLSMHVLRYLHSVRVLRSLHQYHNSAFLL